MKILAATAFAICIAAMQPATAAEFIHAEGINGTPDIIAISGFIHPGDSKKFFTVAWGLNREATVILDSPGGYIDDAIIIGQFVRSHKWETLVQSRAMCNSACTLIWLAGTTRSLSNQARLGFHSASFGPKDVTHSRNEVGNTKMAIYMSGLGVPQQVTDLQPTASPNSMNYVDYAQAKAWGLLSPQVAAADPAPKEPKKAPMFTCLATLCNGVPTSALELAASPQRLTVPQYAVIRRWEAAKPVRVK